VPTAELERKLLKKRGVSLVCGVDEAGVGAWAGPLVAVGVVFDPDNYEDPFMQKLQDSKRLKPDQREALVDEIFEKSLTVSVVSIDSRLIDLMKMKRAHREAIVRSVNILRNRFVDAGVAALIDGEILRSRCSQPLGENTMFMDKADSLSVSVAAASILAKVQRDRIMTTLEREYPGYGFAKNKGYGTEEHATALRELGITPVHRRSFAPIRSALREEGN
jgi:ribonuclease HII